jgi:hypothetical protein
MPDLVLRYLGSGDRPTAERLLCEQFPGLVLTAKTSNFLEANVPLQVDALHAHPDWEVISMSYAAVPKISFDFDRVRKILGRLP